MNVDAAVQRIEALVSELGETDPRLRAHTEEAIHLLMQLYGHALARILEMVGGEISARLARDKLLGSLLLLHGLHPCDAEARVVEALGRVERQLNGHRLHLLSVTDNIAQVRVEAGGGSLPHSLARAIETAIADNAPDIARVDIEGLPESAASLVQIAPAAGR